MRTHQTFFLPLVSCVFLSALPLHADRLEPTTNSFNGAVQEARDAGKLLLFVSGYPACSDCVEFENITLQDREVRPLVEEAFVWYDCREDLSCALYKRYTPDYPSGLFPRPLVCVINPTNENSYMLRTMGGGPPSAFLPLLRTVAHKTGIPRILNLTNNQTVGSADLTVRGTGRWTNVPIYFVTFRLNRSSSWTTLQVPDRMSWAAPLNPVPGTNTFEVYVMNSSFQRSLTNVLSFSYQTNQPPKVIGAPADIPQLAYDQTATFAVQAEGTAPLSYQWQFKGVDIPGATDPVLTIPHVRTNNQGFYAVTVTNNYGATNVSAQLAEVTCPAALGAPETKNLAAQPKDLTLPLQILTAQVGGTATFAVTGYGEPPLYYQWLFKSFDTGTTNVLSDSTHISGATSNVLTISNVTSNDAGEYSVVVTNHCTLIVGTLYDAATLVGRLSVANVPLTGTVPPDAATRAQAIQMGTNQNKMILLIVSDTNNCPGCEQLENITLPSTNPPVRQFLAESFIYWSCGPQENCTEYRLYTGTGTISLPWYCLIDPYHPQTTARVGTGSANVSTFYSWLQRGLLMSTAPIITNLADGQTLTTSNILVQGRSISTNVPIKTVRYQLNNNPWGSFITSNGLDWSTPLVASQVVQGPNVFRVYAVDSTGAYKSRTNVLSFVYTPTGPTDTLAPNLEITGYSNLQHVAASPITLSGTATDAGRDDSGIASVTVNGARAANDTASGSATANWSRQVGLVAGDNTITVIATDGVGNSTSQVIHIIFDAPPVDTLPPGLVIASHSNLQAVASNKITLSGTTSDAGFGDSGIAWVKVNGVRATNDTAVGSAVANWSRGVSLLAGTNTIRVVAADGVGNATTNVIRIISDTARPALVITSPRAGQRWSNAVVTVKGTVRDNAPGTAVWCLTNGVWSLAALGTRGTNWTVDLTLVPGTNTVRAYAVDAAGNRSVTNSVNFVYVLSDRLTLIAAGPGALSPNYSNALLEIGKRYTITAIPGVGNVFSNWVGAVLGNVVILSNAPRLTFTMQSNLVLQANIIPNPFIPLTGTYSGLFFPTANSHVSTTDAAGTNAGFIKLTLTAQGGSSGGLLLAGATLPFSGKFNVQLQAQVSVTRFGKTPLAMSLQLNPALYDPQTGQTVTNVLTGTVADGSRWESDMCAYRASGGSSNAYAGAYTLVIEGCNDWGLCFGNGFTNLPNGDSPAAVTITRAGGIRMTGTLPDGTPISQSATASEQGLWAMYVPLYGGRGFLVGWMTLATNRSNSEVYWQMPPMARPWYTNGFAPQYRPGFLTKYVAPPAGQNAMSWSNAAVQITGGNLPMPPVPEPATEAPTSQVVISNNLVRVVSGAISNLTVSITASSGLFRGTFVNPVSGRVTSFNGALVQDANTAIDGGGWWLGPQGESGNIRFRAE